MSKTFWLTFAAILLTLTGATWALSSVTKYRSLTPKGVPTNLSHEEVLERAAELRRPTIRPFSRAEVPVAQHAFGMMEPGTVRSYMFVVRNTGTEALKLGTPHESCKCAEAEVPKGEIPPGGEGGVLVTWDPGPDERELDISVRVPTSDPNNEELRFVVHGTVRQRLVASPGRLTFEAVVSDTKSTQETLLTSQVWPAFAVEDVTCSIAGATWEVLPATAEQLTAAQAQSGWILRVTLPAAMPRGFIEETLHFRAVPADSQFEPQGYTVPIEGVVKGLMSFYGNALQDGVVEIGSVQQGEERQTRLLIKVRSDKGVLPNVRCETNPACVQATVTPQAQGVRGVYVLDVVVPRSAVACSNLRDDQLGTIRILTDHPLMRETELKLRVAVVPRASPLP